MDVDNIYENLQREGIQDSTGPQTWNHNQDEEKGRKQGSRSRCVLVMMVSLGLLCVLLVVFITLQHISITTERDLYKNTVEELNHTITAERDLYKNTVEELNHTITAERELYKNTVEELNHTITAERELYKNTVEELNHTINSLQHNNTDLNQEKLKLETRVSCLNLVLTEKNKQGNQCGLVDVFISPEAKSWSASRQYCRDRGADLVIIKSEEKQKFITSLAKDRVWIGLSDIESEGKMKWVDNSTLNQGYWYSGEPNDVGGNEDCVELMPPHANNWNDLACSETRKAICEK